ncbi:MAG: serine--tRNA ligase [Candidatus Micrarchaeaceae archaeon]
MLTSKYVRDHIDEIRKSLERRKSDYPIDELLDLDKKVRAMKTEMQDLQAKRNRESLAIAESKKAGNGIKDAVDALKSVKDRINDIEREMPKYEERLEYLVMNMPNTLHESVPYGADETQSVEIKTWGNTGKRLQKGHSEILEGLGLVDTERAAKVAGARFYYLKGDLVLLSQSLIRFALDELSKKGFMPIEPPFMMRKSMYKGVTGLGDFEEALYRATGTKEAEGKESLEALEEELFMIATSEHPMAAMHAGEVLSAKDLPIKYVGVSPCFRREAGAHGKDTKGIFRVHQFDKVEQFVFAKEEDSWKIFEELRQNEEEIWQKLGIPYHVINICTGDIGVVAAKKYDIEGWFPHQGKYRELTSCSNCTNWQSLRLDIKYDDKGERHYVHTLNATAISVERALTVIAENYVNGDGTISVPDVLVPYMGKDRIGKA